MRIASRRWGGRPRAGTLSANERELAPPACDAAGGGAAPLLPDPLR